MNDEGTVVEAGTSEPLWRRGCQKSVIAVRYDAEKIRVVSKKIKSTGLNRKPDIGSEDSRV